MCGIWLLIGNADEKVEGSSFEKFMNLQPRGPDRYQFLTISGPLPTKLGFQRLSIMDLSTSGDQPFIQRYD